MGNAVTLSLDYIESINSYFKRLTFPSGYRAFDWVVPKEWVLRRAVLRHESGIVIADSDRNFLEVLLYSENIDIQIEKKELLPKIHFSAERPKAIPYKTSYYKKDWGFCVTRDVYNNLPEGKYHAKISSSHIPGDLSLSHAHIPGNVSKEILFTSYICHPNLTNNEISGPVLLVALANYISKLSNRHYSYRFLLAPETIGTLCYLSKYNEVLRMNTISGFVLSCVGDDRAYSHISSPSGVNASDIALESALINKPNTTRYSFLDRGSDERQLCSPNVDLPVCGFSRSKYGTYSEYHTSDDDLSVVSEEGFKKSFEVIKNIIDCYEFGAIPKLTTIGEPQLGPRGLYQTFDNIGSRSLNTKNIENLIGYADGERTLFEICLITKMPLSDGLYAAKLLANHGLIKTHWI